VFDLLLQPKDLLREQIDFDILLVDLPRKVEEFRRLRISLRRRRFLGERKSRKSAEAE
jgi:hypothetical protein